MLKEQLENRIKELLKIEKLDLRSGGKFCDFSITPDQVKIISEGSDKGALEITDQLAKGLENSLVSGVSEKSGFINIKLSPKAVIKQMEKVLDDEKKYIKANSGDTVVMDYSSPNIAKPFSVGHLRSTIIGQANLNIHRALGFNTVGINHLGDWGTQFGKLIVAIKKWGDTEKIKKDPISELNALYVKFHSEAEKDSSLEDEARQWFRKLETGDAEAKRYWQESVEYSMAEFERIYKLLGVKIDNAIGESFYNDKTDEVISDLEKKKIIRVSQGAKIVEFDDMPPALITKADGAALYMTRDLAAIKYRVSKFKPSRLIYHVGMDQQFHFRQLSKIAKDLGYLNECELVFAGHGLIRFKDGKMSTRKGQVVLLQELMEEASKRISKLAKEKNADVEDKKESLAISAIKYADLSSNRKSDIVFSFERLIDLKGNSAIYLEYSYARAKSLIREFKRRHKNVENVEDVDCFEGEEIELIKEGIKIREVLLRSALKSQPNILCDFAFSFANHFNAFYEKNRIVSDSSNESSRRITLVSFFLVVLGLALDCLGIDKFDRI
ncbi:MAG: arginine--tRNA ligase [bacterium]